MNVSDTDIRLAMLDIELRERIAYLRLNEREANILELVADGIDTTSKLSEYKMWSIQSCNNYFKQLMKKGYLKREVKAQLSGGHEFVYRNVYERK